jgi:hypothetical protein
MCFRRFNNRSLCLWFVACETLLASSARIPAAKPEHLPQPKGTIFIRSAKSVLIQGLVMCHRTGQAVLESVNKFRDLAHHKSKIAFSSEDADRRFRHSSLCLGLCCIVASWAYLGTSKVY